MFRDLVRKKPMRWISGSTSSGVARARASAVPKRPKRAGVTWLTIRSVVCADSTVATRSWKGP